MRALQTYLRLQARETERQMLLSRARHDTVDADKWRAVADAYANCYTKLFGELKREEL